MLSRQQRGELNAQDVTSVAHAFATLGCGSKRLWAELGRSLLQTLTSPPSAALPFSRASLLTCACTLAWAHAAAEADFQPWLLEVLLQLEPLLTADSDTMLKCRRQVRRG